MCVHLFNVKFYKKLCVVIILLLKTENQSRQLVLLEIYTLWSTMVLTLICKMKYHFSILFKGEFSPNNNVDSVSRKQFYKTNSKSLSKFG